MEMKGGFFAGAVGGLAIALLLVGLVAAFPQANPAIGPSSHVEATETTASVQLANGQAGVGSAPAIGRGAPNVSSSYSPGLGPVTIANANGATSPRPDSLLAVIPGESAASLVGTFSPLLLGVLVAALVYSAYSRRQDAAS
jgi:hypothetical protein